MAVSLSATMELETGKFTGPLKEAQGELASFSGSIPKITVDDIFPEMSGIRSRMDALKDSVAAPLQEAAGSAGQLGGALGGVGTAAMGAIGGVAALVTALNNGITLAANNLNALADTFSTLGAADPSDSITKKVAAYKGGETKGTDKQELIKETDLAIRDFQQKAGAALDALKNKSSADTLGGLVGDGVLNMLGMGSDATVGQANEAYDQQLTSLRNQRKSLDKLPDESAREKAAREKSAADAQAKAAETAARATEKAAQEKERADAKAATAAERTAREGVAAAERAERERLRGERTPPQDRPGSGASRSITSVATGITPGSDRLAAIGGFIGGSGGPALDAARRTATATENTAKAIATLASKITNTTGSPAVWA
jgi:hypothetical protein